MPLMCGLPPIAIYCLFFEKIPRGRENPRRFINKNLMKLFKKKRKVT